MTDSALRQQISREVKRALSDARLSARRAAAKMPSEPDPKLIYRWINGDVTAPLERLEEFAVTVNQPLTLHLGPNGQKETAPTAGADGAMREFLERWSGEEPPPWAAGLTRQIIEAVTLLRGEALEKAAAASARASARALGLQIPDEPGLGNEDQTQGSPEQQAGQQPRSSG